MTIPLLIIDAINASRHEALGEEIAAERFEF